MFDLFTHQQSALKDIISSNERIDEATCIQNLLSHISDYSTYEQRISDLARTLIDKVRNNNKKISISALLQEYKLSTQEGVSLMCLAESLLRIPDKYMRDELIKDKLKLGDWRAHTNTESLFINASSWCLFLTGKLMAHENHDEMHNILTGVISKYSMPIVRKAVETATQFIGNQFIMGDNIHDVLKDSVSRENDGYQFSYDMLGEAAFTHDDAEKYMQSYLIALHAIGKFSAGRELLSSPGISVKLSAIHPRYTRTQYPRAMREIYSKLKRLFMLAKEYNVSIFIDAEEAERLSMSLSLFEQLISDPDLSGFAGMGIAVQAYQRCAPNVIDYLINIAKQHKTRIIVRLVKGAYWDSEIKRSQVDGQMDYPVFTRKIYTDLCYLVCAKKLLDAGNILFPSFATHNAYSIAAIYIMGQGKHFEFQCLYGMGDAIYASVVGAQNLNAGCRIYAPIGNYDTLLAYLARRILENGANSSFVHQISDKSISTDKLVTNPVAIARRLHGASNKYINKPTNIFPDHRVNSMGFDFSNELQLQQLEFELNNFANRQYQVRPLIKNSIVDNDEVITIFNPADSSDVVGHVSFTSLDQVETAFVNATSAFIEWKQQHHKQRAEIFLKFADILELNRYELFSIIVRETGKTLNNAVAEVREAVDFCRYYAMQTTREFNNDTHIPLGITTCISPWNFPLAIFVGQVVSAAMTGNVVLAKPAEQSNIVSFYAVKLMYQAGVPIDVIQLLPGLGEIIGDALTADKRVMAVVFTGSTDVARMINNNLLQHDNYSKKVLIAETGGQNALIADSTALTEQVVADTIASAFDSAGQRCSAMRVLYLQEEVADKTINMLIGAMHELTVGDPRKLNTDVGPVINSEAQSLLLQHIAAFRALGHKIHQCNIPDMNGTFVAPTIIEISSIKQLRQEAFGPILHVARFNIKNLNTVIDDINNSGYGLTHGLQSRLNSIMQQVIHQIKTGNIYINRNIVGAVVGVHPFGGEGLSGTGPKAGGPFYLYRFVETSCAPIINTIRNTHYDFTALNKFIATNDCAEIKSIAEALKHNVLIDKHIELPGPTGEYNYLFFAPRGHVACFANKASEYYKQLTYVLATGNIPVIVKKYMQHTIPNIANLLIVNEINDIELAAALISSQCIDQDNICTTIAKQKIIAHIIFEVNGIYDTHRLITERTVSINTTASGGNMELMSLDDSY